MEFMDIFLLTLPAFKNKNIIDKYAFMQMVSQNQTLFYLFILLVSYF